MPAAVDRLKNLKLGNLVVVRYTEAVAVSLKSSRDLVLPRSLTPTTRAYLVSL